MLHCVFRVKKNGPCSLSESVRNSHTEVYRCTKINDLSLSLSRPGLNAAVVLLVLLLSVPLQLLLSHLVSLSSPAAEAGDITDARTEAMEQ